MQDALQAAQDAAGTILSLEGVNKWFHRGTLRHQHVLKDINLQVTRGEVLVVIGPSGSGKSTLLRCINGLETYQDGSITVDGIEVGGAHTNLRQLRKHVEVAQRQAGLGDEVRREVAYQGRMRAKQGLPGCEATAIRKRLVDHAVKRGRGLHFGRCLHLQPTRRNVLALASIQQRRLRGSTELITTPEAPIERSLSRRFATLADEGRVRRTAAALDANGISVLRAADAADAKRIVLGLIPDGSQVHHGASQTLEATGITEALEKSGRYEPLRPLIWSMDRNTQANEIRRLSAAPDVMLGSVHAITESGSLMTASMGGGQLGPYVSGAGRVILVVGTQKIVADLDEGMRRIEEYAFPLEDARAQAAYGVHSGVNKVLIINREINPGRITVVLVDQALGF